MIPGTDTVPPEVNVDVVVLTLSRFSFLPSLLPLAAEPLKGA